MQESSWRSQLAHSRLVIGALFLTIGVCGGIGLEHWRMITVAANTDVPENVDLAPVWKAWRAIDSEYVPVAVASSTPIATSSPSAQQKRVWGMIQGMVASLNDPYSYFLPPEESKSFADDMSGAFEGVGMQIDIKDSVLTVVSPIKGSPAEAAGIRSGDQILKIDGTDTTGLPVDEAVKKIRGQKGTQVALVVMRTGWTAPHDIKVTRDVITVPEVTTNARKDGVFVISIATFTANSPEAFRNALREFVKSGDTRLIIDLRGNPGGYLDAAVDMASYFLPSGKQIVSEDFDGHSDTIVHRSFGYDVFNDNLKMVVLVDRGTASAAEILANALQFYKKAPLVGSTTFGKGSVQELIPITNDTSLKLTIARWLGPGGDPIPKTGIVPDVKVDLSESDIKTKNDRQMDKAVQILLGK